MSEATIINPLHAYTPNENQPLADLDPEWGDNLIKATALLSIVTPICPG